MTQLEGKKIVVLGGSREHALPQAAPPGALKFKS